MRRLDLVLRQAWLLGLPYWKSAERWRAFALFAVVVFLNLVLVGTTVLFTYWQGAFYNSLQAKDWYGFLGSLLWWHKTPKEGFTLGFAPVLAVFVLATVYELYTRQALQIRWRNWMTRSFVDEWLSDRAYFRMSLIDSVTDNPDQRISEDIRLFTESALTLGLGLVRSFASLLSFIFLLWTLSEPIKLFGVIIHGYLVWIALLYAVFGTWVTHLVGRRLIPLHFVQQKAEADFRFSLVRLRENAEGVAFHNGESEQKREFLQRFKLIVANWRAIMDVTLHLTFLTSSYAQVVLVFPLAVVAPAYFAGRMPLGGIFEISNAFAQVQNALSWVVQSYSDLTGWFATVQRLSGFQRCANDARGLNEGPRVTSDSSDEVKLAGVDLMLPNGRQLLCGIDLRIPRGERLLIRGPSGAGKSTLLRAIAGIWPFGSGTITHGTGRQLFVPQRPYMPLGTLKQAVCYPSNETDFSEWEVTAALKDAGLSHLVEDLTNADVWERRLSGGEQQRLTLARALLIRPEWLFLDEATSALDPTAEAHMYSLLCERLPRSTIVSIAHREDVARFHTRVVCVADRALTPIS